MRSFIAVRISTAQRQKIADLIDDLRQADVMMKWVKPENLHITLKFLGDIDERMMPDICSDLEKSLTNVSRFDLNLARIGCFPNLKRPRVIWVGIEKGADELRQIAKSVDIVTSSFGFEREKRPFSAHLTIGRVKNPKGIDSLTKQFDLIKFNTEVSVVDSIVFYESILKREGPTYIAHKTINLKSMEKEGQNG